MGTLENYDVVIIGSGVAGALSALPLSQRGFRVLILEAGPWNGPREELTQRYFSATARTPGSPYEDHNRVPRPKVIEPNGYYLQKGKDLFHSTYERSVGGTTWHWLGTSLRLLPEDFRLRSLYGQGTDWPLSYEELEPWYGEAEKALGVAGDDRFDLGSPRSAPYPFPPIEQTYLDKELSKNLGKSVFEESAFQIHSTPQTRDPHRCFGSGSCVPICPTGAKYEAQSHIKESQSLGTVVREKSIASKISIDHEGKVENIIYLDWDGREHRVKGKHYVIAANGIETPRLFLMSRTHRFPRGVANSSGQVGRNLMDHPLQLSWALSEKPVYPFRGPLSTSGVETLRDGPFRKSRGAFRIQVSNDGWAWPTGSPTSIATSFAARGFFGNALQDKVKEQVHRQMQVLSLVEQLPSPANRVLISSEQRDAMGLPRPVIHYKVGHYTKKGLEVSRRAHEKLFQAMNATEIRHRMEIYGSGHIMGTCRMGDSPRDSVVDKNLRSHDHPNLFVVGSSVFPTGGTANPTLTIAALALRVADYISKEPGR